MKLQQQLDSLVTIRFRQEKELSETECLNYYLKKESKISFRTLEPTSLARASGFKKSQVHAFHNLLEEVISQNTITPRPLIYYG